MEGIQENTWVEGIQENTWWREYRRIQGGRNKYWRIEGVYSGITKKTQKNGCPGDLKLFLQLKFYPIRNLIIN